MNKFLVILFPIFLTLVFFWQFFFKGLLPIPSDTIIGLYHPYRDLYAKDYPRGITFKNFLITDPVRQQYPWKNLSIDLLKKGKLPLWNPYSFSGTPLLANFQSSVFYPLNILFFVLPFNLAWSTLIFSEIFMGLIFMFLYLNNLKLDKRASIFGSLVFSFCGFSIAWLEWGNILHTAIWLPLMLLAIDKIIQSPKLIWPFIFIFSLISSFFAGHLQIFFYLLILSVVYFLYRWVEQGKNKKILILFSIFYLLFTIITSVQWLPTLQFISESARNIDQSNWQKLGWFIPWQNLLQFAAPDFFGNPATLNYWGVFNYGEFIGYIGIVPLLFSLYALFFRKERITFLFGFFFFVSLIFSLPTIFAKLPYILNLPLISTAQPTRLIFVIDFSLAILSALGLDLFIKQSLRSGDLKYAKKEKKKIFYPAVFLLIAYSLLWVSVFILIKDNSVKDNLSVAKSNLILPTGIFITGTFLFVLSILKTFRKFSAIVVLLFLGLTIFDLFRFGWKFTPFTKSEYLFPNTKTLSFLQNQNGQFRIMTTDSRIFSPNFSDIYKIQSIDGYDPLYLQRYAELISASERGEPNISPPFGFDRIITPHNTDSKIIDLLGVKYVLSLSDIQDKKFEKVFTEGETRLYENKEVFPRTFFINNTVSAKGRAQSIELLFANKEKLRQTAIVENFKSSNWSMGRAQILTYEENKILVETENKGDGFLVLTDTFYPTWHARIDGKKSKIYKTDYNFRGIVVPQGKHRVEFNISLF